MNANECADFQSAGDFLEVVENWKEYTGPATYMIVLGRVFERLHGSSNILYVGSSDNIGGVERNSRLWSYKYPNEHEKRIVGSVRHLVGIGDRVFFHICSTPSRGMTVVDYETHLLERYFSEHWELPPLNRRL